MMRSNDLSVQQLHTFRDVYEQGGYAAAARESGLSTPTVWQHIQGLETLYGVPLFRKVGRRVCATPAADQLYSCLVELLVGLESTFDIVQPGNGKDDRDLILVTGVRMMLEDLATPLSQFREEFTQTKLHIIHGNNQRAEELILAGEADLALTLEPGFQQDSPMIQYEPAYSIEFLAVCPESHPFAKVKKVTLKEIVKHDLIVTAPGTYGRDALDQALHKEGLKPKIAAETDNSGFTLACVEVGMGLGIVAGRPAGRLCRGLTVRSLRPHLGHRQIVFMWQKGRRLTPALESLINQVQGTLQDSKTKSTF
ncbi:LysR family transcriptional regulator [Planctomycetales bacterium 10988]|nr:LysR family transcriptional regulator [Planctomycetales bacterium 10988]